MSRGAGWVGRAIIDALTRKAVLDTYQVAAKVFDCRLIAVSAAQLASVRRALRNLEKQVRWVSPVRPQAALVEPPGPRRSYPLRGGRSTNLRRRETSEGSRDAGFGTFG